ncbi:hypothetical protein, partial [Segatella copri]|uniref:hypothetical protein n=1 Tax=Segatella copri TaxID=165179 RepID=UPI001F3C8F81
QLQRYKKYRRLPTFLGTISYPELRSNCNIHKNDEGSWDVIFELRPDGDGYCRNICITVCVYNRSEKPVLLRSIDIRDFENFNIYTIKGLQMLPAEEIGRIFVFPTRLI